MAKHLDVSSFIRASKKISDILGRGWDIHPPLSVSKVHRQDDGTVYDVGTQATHRYFKHLKQEIDYNNIDIEYRYNTLGFRGPEPNFLHKKRVLFIGNCTTFGIGVNYEDTYVSKLSNELDFDHINVAEYIAMEDGIRDAYNHLLQYKPQVIVITDTRFIKTIDTIYNRLFTANSSRKQRKELSETIKDLVHSERSMWVRYVENFLLSASPNSKIIWFLRNYGYEPDYTLNNEHFDYSLGEVVFYDHVKIMKDLSRDMEHPGPKSHENIGKVLKPYLVKYL